MRDPVGWQKKKKKKVNIIKTIMNIINAVCGYVGSAELIAPFHFIKKKKNFILGNFDRENPRNIIIIKLVWPIRQNDKALAHQITLLSLAP